ncbi:rCG26024 [Rattus norvegicus]|uniref:RCG26024 n=1 Tax=Rattus norvegicus TaxID=10116 RepID=A6I312_RAT|nr:rCG26024 [Rattus norvegicus]
MMVGSMASYTLTWFLRCQEFYILIPARRRLSLYWVELEHLSP